MKMRTWLMAGRDGDDARSGRAVCRSPRRRPTRNGWTRQGLSSPTSSGRARSPSCAPWPTIRRKPTATRRSSGWRRASTRAGDDPAAIQTIARLEGQYPASRWVRLGRSLRVEIAQRLNLDDVLWAVAAPPAPPAPPAPRAATTPPAPAAPRTPPTFAIWPAPAAPAVPPAPPAAARRLRRGSPLPRPPMAPPRAGRPARAAGPGRPHPGLAEYFLPPTPFPPDTDLQHRGAERSARRAQRSGDPAAAGDRARRQQP